MGLTPLQIKSEIDDLIIFFIIRSGWLKSKKCDLTLYVSTDITNSFFLSKKTSSFKPKADLLCLDKIFQTILKAATYEFMYKPNLSINIIIKEYLNSSNFFLEDSQTKYLNALLDDLGKKLRANNAWIWIN